MHELCWLQVRIHHRIHERRSNGQGRLAGPAWLVVYKLAGTPGSNWTAQCAAWLLQQLRLSVTAGAFPLWLAPVQVCLLLVAETEALRAYADSVAAQMRSAGLRVEIKSGACTQHIAFASACCVAGGCAECKGACSMQFGICSVSGCRCGH